MKTAHPLPPEDLMAYLDGEVNGDEAHRIQAHLTGCEACRQLAADLHDGSTQMKEWRIDDPPASLVAPRTRRSTERRYPWLHVTGALNRVRQRPLLAGTAGIVLIAAVIVMPLLRQPRMSSISLSASEEPRKMPTTIVEFNASAPRGFQQTGAQGIEGEPARQASAGPRIVRTATLRIVATDDFDRIRPAVDRILQSVGGFVGDITAFDKPGSARSLRGTLRIPSAQFDAALARLRALGRVSEDAQNAEDVTATVVDLDVRLANGRMTEKRLSQVLNRTGSVADVLEVEREIARVRTEIEQLEAQQTQLDRRIEYATLTLDVVEERTAAVTLGPVPIPTRLSHAIADGLESAAMSMLDITLFVLRAGPVTLLWVTVLGLPAWWFFRRQTTRTT